MYKKKMVVLFYLLDESELTDQEITDLKRELTWLYGSIKELYYKKAIAYKVKKLDAMGVY